jgi:hypothetical protein
MSSINLNVEVSERTGEMCLHCNVARYFGECLFMILWKMALAQCGPSFDAWASQCCGQRLAVASRCFGTTQTSLFLGYIIVDGGELMSRADVVSCRCGRKRLRHKRREANDCKRSAESTGPPTSSRRRRASLALTGEI